MFRSVKTRIVTVFVAVLVVIIAIGSVAGYQYWCQYEHDLTDSMGATAANACATVLELMLEDGGLSPGSETYEKKRNTLRKLCQESHMEYMYAYHCDRENKEITYIICVAADDADDEVVARERPYGATVHEDLSEQEQRALAGERGSEPLVLDNQFGSTLAWFEKVDGQDDDIIAGAEYSAIDQRDRVYWATAVMLVPFALSLVVLMLIQLYLLRKYVFKPIGVIAERMKSFSTEHAIGFEPIGIASHDEMGEISSAFEGMAADIGTYLKDIERMTTERVQADVELDVARRIQLGIVPEHAELTGSGYDACALSRPARSVGGDFYDLFELGDGTVAAVVGDVSGKGVAAALFMSVVKTMIHDGLLTGGGPAEVLNDVNARLCDSNPEGMFTTALVCVLDPRSGQVRIGNAGHMPPVVIGQDARELDVAPGILLGLFDDADIDETTFELRSGECLLLFTDGVTEAVNDQGAFFGMGGLLRCLEGAAPFASAACVVETVAQSAASFADGREQFDDVTTLALHASARASASASASTNSSASTSVCEDESASANTRANANASTNASTTPAIALPVDIDSFAFVRDEILGKAPNRTLGMRACLACEEAFANIVSYSGAQGIWVSVEAGDEGLRVVLEDDGIPFNPLADDMQEKSFDELDQGGMGRVLIRDMARQAAYRRAANRNVLDLLF